MQYFKQQISAKKNYLWMKLSSLFHFTVMSSLLLGSEELFADVYFNPSFLSGNVASVADLSRFEKGEQPAGIYRVEIYLNNEYIATQDIRFNIANIRHSPNMDSTGLVPCLNQKWLEQKNIKVEVISNIKTLAKGQCIDLTATLNKVETRFDFERQKLYMSIPQAAFKNNIRGYIPPEQWDDGINALLLDYNLSASHRLGSQLGVGRNSYYLNMNNRVNIGAWRFHHRSSWNQSDGGSEWSNTSTYAQRTIIALRSSLILGDNFTSSDVFDSVGFRGAQLSSDDSMLPDSLRGFAPSIHSFANRSAQVTIRQNGYVIYQTHVPPGAFEIGDLYPISTSGEFQVTVKEDNGVTQQFMVPYSSLPILQRDGRFKYSLTAGQFRSASELQNENNFLQGILMWGLPSGMTLFGGTQLSNRYQAFALGIGQNIGVWGALSIDVTQAKSFLADDSHRQGESLRLLYTKSLNNLGMNIQLQGTYYLTQGFYTLSEASYKDMQGYNLEVPQNTMILEPEISNYHNLYYSKKQRVQANINQQIGTYGSLYLAGSWQTYWQTEDSEQFYQIGYNGNWNNLSYGVYWSFNQSTGQQKADKRFMFTVSFPLSTWLSSSNRVTDIGYSKNSAHAIYSITRDAKGKSTQLTGIHGTLLNDNNLSYNIQQGYSNQNEGAFGSANLSYQGSYNNSSVGYNYSQDWQQVNYGFSGAMVIHADGLTLSRPLGETNALVKAEGADDVVVQNSVGIRTNDRGYAIVPHMTAYRSNRIALDAATFKDNVELGNTVLNVIPTQGALVMATFDTHIGIRARFRLTRPNGLSVPFGSLASDDMGNLGIVDENGLVFMSGLAPQGNLKISWGKDISQQCIAAYFLRKETEKRGIWYTKAQCQ